MKWLILFIVSFLASSIFCQANIKDAKFLERLINNKINNVNLQKSEGSLEKTFNTIISKVNLHPDTGLDISQYLEKYNYPLEAHEVGTEDGFILTVHRIPHGRNETSKVLKEGAKPAVLLVPGLSCPPLTWVNQGPDKALGLLLADIGYDVWIINTRGTQYSMKHKSLNSSDPAFWDFSWHEKGFYDVPATIDYILNNTGVQKLTTVGYSEGTTVLMVLGTARSEYNAKLNLMSLLSPLAYMDGVSSPPFVFAAKYLEPLQKLAEAIKMYGIAYSPLYSVAINALCSADSPFQQICVDSLGWICGPDEAQINKTYLSVLLTGLPSGMALKEGYHYGQEIRSGYFRQYDHGSDAANFQHYGTNEPPSYDLTKITAPVALYYGKNDRAASIKDVEKLIGELSNKADTFLVEYEYLNHLDFIWATDVKTLVYDRLISVIQQYNPLNG